MTTLTVEIVRDPHTQVLKAYVTQDGRRATANLLAGRMLTKLESAQARAADELRRRLYAAPWLRLPIHSTPPEAELEINFVPPPESGRPAAKK